MNECPIAATVPDANRQQLAYVYYENEPGRRSAAKLLTKDEARRIATQRQAPRAIKSPSDVGSALRVRARSRTMRFLTIQVPSQPNACSQHCKDADQRVHMIHRHNTLLTSLSFALTESVPADVFSNTETNRQVLLLNASAKRTGRYRR